MVFSLGQTVVDMMANGRMANSTELVLIFPVRKRRNAVSGLKENASLGSMVAMTKTEVKIENYLNNGSEERKGIDNALAQNNCLPQHFYEYIEMVNVMMKQKYI
jgi:hypothetical protein